MLRLIRPQVTPAVLLTRFLEEVDRYPGSTRDIIKHSANIKELLTRPKSFTFEAIVSAIENLPPADSSDQKGGKRFRALTGLILYVSRPPKNFTKQEHETIVKAWVNLCQVLARL